ncbi:hypothetical protein SAMN05421741_10417 [Paenimyroides ummariense]|uniref:Uncharacterized protein n=1 Tax=Paenimyroides ummariense TaxID=913024 RepID=A0A1I4Y4U7_9FLAO|nr:hypothetical protein [Paenimyroides ummariense]SFN33076.1 hypothetical protein SAMN05421741_10417 [Paenimyroides ummariense]
MKLIVIKIENGVKRINNQNVDEVIKGLNPNFIDVKEIKRIFEEINSEEDLIDELKKISNKRTLSTILRYIVHIGNLSIYHANLILDKVLI